MKRALGILVAALLLTGCAGVRPVRLDVTVKSSASYELGRLVESKTGGPMAVEADLRYYDAPVVVADYQPPGQLGTTYPVIRRGMVLLPYGRLGNGDVLYMNPDLRPRVIPYGDRVKWDYCVAVTPAGKAYGDAACAAGLVREWPDAPERVVEIRRLYMKGSVWRKLDYSGRSLSSILLTYREFRVDPDVAVITEPLAYDLDLSHTIRFRKMEIEVIDATDSSIRYIIKSTMDGSTSMEGITVEPEEGG
ncbi:MAG: hypothetical protein ACE5GY_04945 [Thermodesulfobacteriota bacterium]